MVQESELLDSEIAFSCLARVISNSETDCSSLAKLGLVKHQLKPKEPFKRALDTSDLDLLID